MTETIDIRAGYAAEHINCPEYGWIIPDGADPEREQEFDNWFAEEIRKAKEEERDKTLEDLHEEGFLNEDELEMFSAWHNPHRKETND